MEALNIRAQVAYKTLTHLHESLEKLNKQEFVTIYEVLRCAILKRFTLCFDSFFKFIVLFFQERLQIVVEGISPRQILQAALDALLISPEEFKSFLSMIEDRHLASHAYHEELAQEITQRIPDYYNLMHAVYERLS